MITLNDAIESLPGITSYYISRLHKLGVYTVEDLLYHIPFRYEDLSVITKINLLQPGETVTIVGKIIEFKNVYTKFGKKIQKGKIEDETGQVEVVWYNQPFLTKILIPGLDVTIAGKVDVFANKPVFKSPDYEVIRDPDHLLHTGRIVPVYPETKGLTSKWLRTKIGTILPLVIDKIEESVPSSVISKYQLVSLADAFEKIHNPLSLDDAQIALRKLAFDELLPIQIAAILRRKEWEKNKVGRMFDIKKHNAKLASFIKNLPFQLTSAQQLAVHDIMQDLSNRIPMNRLLEGDVGSGKTVVAAIAMYLAYLNGYQSMLMAPTEILASQHFLSIQRLLEPLGVNITLITGTKKPKLADETGKKIAFAFAVPDDSREYDMYVGTHALLSTKLKLPKVGLVIIDEQQRFGVSQRTKLREKGKHPHVLSMTATPIPRTIALTLHADLDLSILDEMPKGRLKVKTWVVPPEKRSAAYEWIRKQIVESGYTQQAFIICPLVEESESLASIKSAKKEYEELQKHIFPDLKLGLVHGKLTPSEKNTVLSDFKEGKYHILVATPVVEVGIDIPNATIIMIEASDRFGLSQLHQLRGRVGRNSLQAYCLLFTETTNEKTITRLKAMETTFSGPKLAELDLKLRGPGDLYGTRQHGGLGLRFASLSDIELIKMTREAARNVLSLYPALTAFPLLQEKVRSYTIREVAPD